MSYIDNYDHEYLGDFGYLPIYRPLASFGEGLPRGAHDFGAGPDNLILGGGSGERPAIVVHELAACAGYFLLGQLNEGARERLSSEDLELLHHLWLTPADRILEFCGWMTEDHAAFFEMIRSARMRTPYDPDDGGSTAEWLIRNLGEFVYFALPTLNPLQQRMTALARDVDIRARYENVVCPPPGYPPRGGRKTIDGKPVWGLHRWLLDDNI